MIFSEWLQDDPRNNPNPIFSFDSYGRVTVHIQGRKYIYFTDVNRHRQWKAMIYVAQKKSQPAILWKVLNEIKKDGEQIYPPKPPKPDVPQQKRLF